MRSKLISVTQNRSIEPVTMGGVVSKLGESVTSFFGSAEPPRVLVLGMEGAGMTTVGQNLTLHLSFTVSLDSASIFDGPKYLPWSGWCWSKSESMD